MPDEDFGAWFKPAENVSERSAWNAENDGDRRSALSEAFDAAGGGEEEDKARWELPADGDDSIRADAMRAWYSTEEDAHTRAMAAKDQAKLDEIEAYSKAHYGQSAAQTFAQLDNLHALAVHNPQEFAQRWQQILQNPRGYTQQFERQRMEHAEAVVDGFLAGRGIKPDSAVTVHIGEILADPSFRRSGDLQKDLRAAYATAVKRAA